MGTPIIQALGVVLQDDRIWENPLEFNPDRFDPENKKKIPTLAFSPFGFAGKRVCPGYRFAQTETALFLAGIIRLFKITLADPTSPVIPVYDFVTAPKDEIMVQIHQRKL
jgi:cytochrome P450 family 20 subfamily A